MYGCLLEVPLLDGLLKLRQSGGDEGRMHVSCNAFDFGPLLIQPARCRCCCQYLLAFASLHAIRRG